ncbi:MAG: Nif11-like leader peptide family natural product precursor [Proteobacteria bacterium]|nr:Nif11-like leader peptide family natural product precursor [Desulfobacula sp.]MBU3953988.1 Nif11-like leader peptide family natural product precursor [Pseudomonadota bacterium]MBU4131470.1 Nif11-like leader peptide family natural product precursor [Pseudomonadota bacterium]
MSLENAASYLYKMRDDADFRSAIREAADDEARLKLAHEAGLVFTHEEFEKTIEEMKANNTLSIENLGHYEGGLRSCTPQ